MTTAITGFLGVGAIAALYVMGLAACKPMTGSETSLAALAHGTMSKLQPPATPSSYPDAGFVDGAGKPVKLSDFKGQAVVLNLWATWCAPCVKEMPTLAALQTAYAGKGLKVVALSADSPFARDKAKAFIAAHPPLDFYQDRPTGGALVHHAPHRRLPHHAPLRQGRQPERHPAGRHGLGPARTPRRVVDKLIAG